MAAVSPSKLLCNNICNLGSCTATNDVHGCDDLLDHLVGAGEEGFGNGEADRFRGFDVDDELELGRLLDRQVGCLLAFENSAGIDADLTERVGNAAESGQARVRMRIMKVS